MIQEYALLICVADSVDDFGIEKANGNSASMEATENAELKEVSGVIKILSYNVWFREDIEVHNRMQAIGDLIQLHSPDVICFQVLLSGFSISQAVNMFNILHV